MLRLRGNFPAKVDDNGRLKLPTPLKSKLDTYAADAKVANPAFFLTSLDGRSARLYPLPEWEAIEASLYAAPSTHPARRKFAEMANHYGTELELDSQGRFVIPPRLREVAQLGGSEVAILGQGNFLALWNRAVIEQKLAAEPLSDEDYAALSEFGI